jgi:ferritin
MENPSPNMLKRTLKTEFKAVSTPTIQKKPSSKKHNPLITEECIKYLNYRIEQEEYSARVYLAMSMWLEDNGYLNAGKLWRKYSDEEMLHANDARTYLLAMGVQPLTPSLESPEQTFTGLPQIIEKSYEHEIEVTTQIKDLSTHAIKIGDHMLYQLGLAYLKEQLEEHGKMQDLMDQLEAFGTDKIAMRLFDHELKDYL